VVALGRRGLSRSEIGPALGMEMDALAALEAADADFARAMRQAGEAERAWWEGLPREALGCGARFNFGGWREAMRWRFGAAEAAGAGASKAAVAAAAAAPERPTVRYYIPDNLRQRRLADGTPITPQMRRERAIAQAQPFLDAAERRMARAEEELAGAQEDLEEWREEMRNVEARNYDPDAEDDERGEDEDDDEDETEDWDEDDRIDDEDGDDDAGDTDDDGRRDDGRRDDGRRDDGPGDGCGDGDGGGEGDAGADSGGERAGAGGRVSGGAAGCERAVPAGLAGPPAWGAQPHVGADHARAAEELRGQPG
jgi:hypothetical protein